jgi:hypothetical protein
MQADVQDDGLLAQAAALAGATVAIVKHSGQQGTHEEFVTLVKALEDAAVQYPDNPYVQALLTDDTRTQIAQFDQQFEEVPKQSVVNDFKMVALNRCAQAVEWLGANVPLGQAAEVKISILAACRRVAGESKEDDPYNLTGENVDVFEEGVIGEISRALEVKLL